MIHTNDPSKAPTAINAAHRKKLLEIRDSLRKKIAQEKQEQAEQWNRLEQIDEEVNVEFQRKFHSKEAEFEQMYQKLLHLKNSIV